MACNQVRLLKYCNALIYLIYDFKVTLQIAFCIRAKEAYFNILKLDLEKLPLFQIIEISALIIINQEQ